MKYFYCLSLTALFVINTANADNATIQTHDAAGGSQSVTVDQNGNLQVAPNATKPSTPPVVSTNSSSSAPSLPRPPAPLYGTVGGASVTQAVPPAAAPKANVPAVAGAPTPANPNQAIGNAQPMIPGQSRAQ